ncbi:hypothetical protein [Frankia sp. CiP3]|uniref:hypothetical protein n=1 Tax=Frankia sp. CiP3 TaxID=2880971 RepID=UPI001EF487E4|nr:hypothetical protein [Frankia sp. CiP3]
MSGPLRPAGVDVDTVDRLGQAGGDVGAGPVIGGSGPGVDGGVDGVDCGGERRAHSRGIALGLRRRGARRCRSREHGRGGRAAGFATAADHYGQ